MFHKIIYVYYDKNAEPYTECPLIDHVSAPEGAMQAIHNIAFKFDRAYQLFVSEETSVLDLYTKRRAERKDHSGNQAEQVRSLVLCVIRKEFDPLKLQSFILDTKSDFEELPEAEFVFVVPKSLMGIVACVPAGTYYDHEDLKDTKYDFLDVLSVCPKNKVVTDNIIKAWHHINNPAYKTITCSISGGADSDVMMRICALCDIDKKINYVFFNTGIEYKATKEHLKYLEDLYEVEFDVEKAKKPIPWTCNHEGLPFLSKQASEYIHRLQLHHFDFSRGDRSFEELYEEYPRCKAALKWWCNQRSKSMNIEKNKYLKEFLIQNPPEFAISSRCCDNAKKKPLHEYVKKKGSGLDIYGVRKAEGGVRSFATKNCFDEKVDGVDRYRPLFWYTNQDKIDFESAFGVIHSKCYTEYGLKRTGCAGCPFGKRFEEELDVIREHEPVLYRAIGNIFGKSYEYTRKYRAFAAEMEKQKQKDALLDEASVKAC